MFGEITPVDEKKITPNFEVYNNFLIGCFMCFKKV